MAKVKVGRLAFRVEGVNWNAYYASPDSMENAIYLGSIRMSFVERNPRRKHEFMSLMRSCFADAVKELTGEYPSWESPISAPEHERTKE